jgi:hypothetical protein
MPFGRAREPFSHPDWLFEVKWDGFRWLVRIDSGVCKLMSLSHHLLGCSHATESGKSAVMPRKASVLLYVLDVKVNCVVISNFAI